MLLSIYTPIMSFCWDPWANSAPEKEVASEISKAMMPVLASTQSAKMSDKSAKSADHGEETTLAVGSKQEVDKSSTQSSKAPKLLPTQEDFEEEIVEWIKTLKAEKQESYARLLLHKRSFWKFEALKTENPAQEESECLPEDLD